MMTAISTAQPDYGLEGPSAGRTVDIATPQGSTYLRGNSVQSNGAGSGGLSSASALNYAGCMYTGNQAVANKCTIMSAAAKKCKDIGSDLMNPPITIAEGAVPNPTVQGSYYITVANDLALTTAGVTCTFVVGDGSAAGTTKSFIGYATGA